jgi:RNA polymerase sigma-32 factor
MYDESDVGEKRHEESDGLALDVLNKILESNRANLNRAERRVIGLRFLDEEPHTLMEAGKKVGVSKERIRQIQVKAMEKIRNAFEAEAERILL